jgi:glycosyltransferase involved in cell wall biosynthesis
MPQKITVLVLSTNADLAGAPSHVYTLISSLKQKVNFVAVFGEQGKISERLLSQRINVEIVEQMRSEMRPIKDLITFFKLLKLTRKIRPDVIHAHSTKAGMHARLLSFFLRIPCIYTVHGWGWRGLNPFGARLVRYTERILSLVSLQTYIYVANAVEKDAIEILKIPKEKGSVIYNGINPLRPQDQGSKNS